MISTELYAYHGVVVAAKLLVDKIGILRKREIINDTQK